MQPENGQIGPLSDLEITPRDIAADYHKGDAAFDRYERFCHGDVGNTKRDRERAEIWRVGAERPFFIRGITKLHALGVLEGIDGYEFDPDGEQKYLDVTRLESFRNNHRFFELLCMLSDLIYWTGTYCKNATANTSKIARVTFPEIPEIQHAIDYLLRTLSEKDFCHPKQDNHTMQINCTIARFLGTLGIPLGKKKNRELFFPAHIHRALASIKSSTATSEEKRLAYNILFSFICTFFIFRIHESQSRNYSGTLIASDTEQESLDQKALFKTILKLFGFSEGKFSLYDQESEPTTTHPTHKTIVVFPDMEIHQADRIRNEFAGRIMAVLSKAGA